MEDKFAVSVFMITYNHEKYIREALDSVLMQKVNFKYEIVIGDDCSTDNTREILKEYYRRYPDRIKLILRKKNLGPTKNAYDVFRRLTGTYVACLEGDDYWTDDKKLQKQYDFMEQHREFSGCGHDFRVIWDDGKVELEHGSEAKDFVGNPYKFKDNICTLHDFEKTKGIPVHGNTLLFRNFMLDKTVDYTFFYKVHPMIGDQSLFLTILARGNIYILPDNMSVYRLIRKVGESNYSSIVKNKNVQYDFFMHHVKLEYYMRKNLNCVVDLHLVKKNNLAAAVSQFVSKKSWNNFKVICQIVRKSGNAVEFGAFAVKAIFLKQFYILTGQKDKRVNVI